MKLIKHINIEYDNFVSNRKIEDVDILVEDNRFSKDSFNYFFELHENEDIVVFANLGGYELEEEDIESGYGRSFQIETALLVKKENIIYYQGDNNGFNSLSFLNDVPVWTTLDLYHIGIKEIKDAGLGFPYNERWEDYVKQIDVFTNWIKEYI